LLIDIYFFLNCLTKAYTKTNLSFYVSIYDFILKCVNIKSKAALFINCWSYYKQEIKALITKVFALGKLFYTESLSIPYFIRYMPCVIIKGTLFSKMSFSSLNKSAFFGCWL
jgi:hypothetical protein